MEPYQATWSTPYQPLGPGYRAPSRWPSTGSAVLLGGLTSLLGLVLWAVGLLRARGTTEQVVSKVGFTPAALQDLHTQVSLGVGLLVPLVLLILMGITWLEGLAPDTPGRPHLAPGQHLSALVAATCSTWLLLFAAAGAVMAAGAWLIGMQVLQAYTPGGGGWGPWWPPVATAPAPAPSGAAGVGSAAARVLSSVTGGSLLAGVAPVAPGAAAGLLLSAPAAPGVGGGWPCADGCVDLGWWGVAGGGGPHLGGPCICTPQLLKDLEQKIEQVEGLLVMSLLGALLLLGSGGALHGTLAAAWARRSDGAGTGPGGAAPASSGAAAVGIGGGQA